MNNLKPIEKDYSTLEFPDLVALITLDWSSMSVHAKPYHSAMKCMNSEFDNYYMDPGYSIINYFIANASQWRGETARTVKKELLKRAQRAMEKK